MNKDKSLLIDYVEAKSIFDILLREFNNKANQQPLLIKRKFELMSSIISRHRKIEKGGESSLFGLINTTADDLMIDNKKSYKEMIEVGDAFDNNEFEIRTIYGILDKIETKFEMNFLKLRNVKYIPFQETDAFQLQKEYFLLVTGLDKNTPEEQYKNIISRYSPFRVR
jgi:hypothetical protein